MSRNKWVLVDASGPVVAVTCWCERRVVRVARERFLAGKTESCGARDCRDDEEMT